MPGMRALIVDDEPVARKIIREELELLESIEIVGEAENGEIALQKISSTKPDIVFLDIQMPVMSGFELLDHMNSGHLPVVVMVTAYDRYAIQAFEAGAVDYLLKPIGHQRLAQAVERAKRIAEKPLQVAENLAHLQEIVPRGPAESPKVRKIVGRLDEDFFLLSLDEVLAFQATGDVTWIITSQKRYKATQNLKSIEERLQDSSFRRIHRNALVNIERIRKLSMITSQRWIITLNNGNEFIVSKREASKVRDILKW